MAIPWTSHDLENHDAISLVIQNNEGKILTFWHNKFSFRTIPLGKAEKGQTPEDAAKQEALEELGITVTGLKLLGADMKQKIREGRVVCIHLFCFLVESFEGTITNNEPHKHADIAWCSLDELKALTSTSDATKLFLQTRAH